MARCYKHSNGNNHVCLPENECEICIKNAFDPKKCMICREKDGLEIADGLKVCPDCERLYFEDSEQIKTNKIVFRLIELGEKIKNQDNRSTANPVFGVKEKEGYIDQTYISLFEEDIEGVEYSYVFCSYKAQLMNELRNLLVELSNIKKDELFKGNDKVYESDCKKRTK